MSIPYEMLDQSRKRPPVKTPFLAFGVPWLTKNCILRLQARACYQCSLIPVQAPVEGLHGHKSPLGTPNQCWLSLDLLEVLCQLAELGQGAQTRSLLDAPLKVCPEVLLLGMAQLKVRVLFASSLFMPDCFWCLWFLGRKSWFLCTVSCMFLCGWRYHHLFMIRYLLCPGKLRNPSGGGLLRPAAGLPCHPSEL